MTPVSADSKPPGEPASAGPEEPQGEAPLPKLPVRASIYIDPDGSVHFGALFGGLVPVAQALGGGPPPVIASAAKPGDPE